VSATFWAVLVIFLASFAVLAILLVGLVRQLKSLASTMKRFQERVQPLAERLASEGAAAQDRMQEISGATASIRAGGRASANGSAAEPRGTQAAQPESSTS
jgi:hypothetical protein